MKDSGISGQAVLEGLMMRRKNKYAVAVRKPDNDIEVSVSRFNSLSLKHNFFKLPFIRGIVNFVESLYLGFKTFSMYENYYEEEEKKSDRAGNNEMLQILLVIAAISLAIAMFIVLPYGLSMVFRKVTSSDITLTVIEGIIRLVLLLSYLVAVSMLPDINRLYMYNGAGHKVINCIEKGLPLNVSNARKMSKKHYRSGTSFVIDVVILSVVLFMFM